LMCLYSVMLIVPGSMPRSDDPLFGWGLDYMLQLVMIPHQMTLMLMP
jgi:hypothetical protein